jgi:Tfp pilus assembly protein PilX
MNHKPNPDRSFLNFMLRAQQLARQDARSDKGYVMMMTSLISISLFSLLAAYFTLTNLSKSSTNAYIDGTSTFYAAESGLNRRAEQLRQKFIDYANPTGTLTNTSASLLSTCTPVAVGAAINPADDYECRNYSFTYNNNIAQATSGGNTVLSEQDGGQNRVNYTAYTFVKPERDYSTTPPAVNPIPAGQTYAGLNALEYRYTVYSTAAKPDLTNPTNPTQQSQGQTVLQMDFKSRIVPLFQFAAFYKEDLEMTSTSTMTLSGRVHTNANFYLQPTPQVRTNPVDPTAITTYFYSPITVGGDIYNRADASTIGRYSPPRILLSGNPFTNSPVPIFYADNLFRSDTTNPAPLTPPEIAAFGGRIKDRDAGATVLNTPEAGFLRKRNYSNNKIGDYYAKADLRLEMVPDRDITITTRPANTVWSRNSAIIPFNFTSIQTGGAGACTTTLPAAGTDPDPAYIDGTRNNASSLRCNIFTKGQLQSLRQPVMVLTNINQSNVALRDTTLPTTAAPSPTRGTESTILGRPATFSPPTGLTAAVTGNVTTQNSIIRALQVALVSTPSPVSLDQLDLAFNNSSYNANTNLNPGITFNGSLLTFRQTFGTLLNNIGIATGSTDYNALLAASPNSIAALRGAWFLPAPVQRIENRNATVQIGENPRNSGFYDGRERRWITMLQTNIASLSVWNRDGLYVDASDTVLTTPYQTTAGLRNTAFNGGTGANPTNDMAFVKSAATGTVGLPSLGLGSSDTTEGGLVFNATVNDDLDGSGGALVAANDVTADSAPLTLIYKKNPDGTDFRDSSNNRVIVDYPRKYLGGASGGNSPFGFAFNGGDYLPGAMTLVTDQAIYVQGNFNNNNAFQPDAAVNIPSPARRAAAIMGDTITILSNQCLGERSVVGTTLTNYLNTPNGQISCGLPSTGSTGTGSAVGFARNFYTVIDPTAVNAAFLSSTNRSCGNLGPNRTCAALPRSSGGLNNYMRMLEDWRSTRYFNYSGSFVSLGEPLEYSGNYLPGGTYYNIPVRNFNFEQNFNSFNLLPPLSPSAIYLQQEVFKRAYN